MKIVHEVHEVGGCPKPAGWSEVAGCLISPRTIEGMFHDRKELNMRKSGVMDVVSQNRGQFAIGQPPITFRRYPLPRTEMHFVDRHGRIQRVALRPARHPRFVVPSIGSEIPHAGRRLRSNLGRESVGIGFVNPIVAKARLQVILVNGPLPDIGHETFPNASGARTHHADRWIPVVEISDNRDELRIRRPNRELHPATAIILGEVST